MCEYYDVAKYHIIIFLLVYFLAVNSVSEKYVLKKYKYFESLKLVCLKAPPTNFKLINDNT